MKLPPCAKRPTNIGNIGLIHLGEKSVKTGREKGIMLRKKDEEKKWEN
jgi:hypothetical protein